MSGRETLVEFFLGCGLLSVRREAANRVTNDCWNQRRCGAVGVHLKVAPSCGEVVTRGVVRAGAAVAEQRERAVAVRPRCAARGSHGSRLRSHGIHPLASCVRVKACAAYWLP